MRGGAGLGAGGALGALAGRLLTRRGARVSPVVDLAAVDDGGDDEDEEMVLPAALFSGAGAGGSGAASGVTTRRRPSASALRRTRSAWASSMEDEWLLTPMPRERARSSPSLLLRPSSLASS
jgi:hypothetical protein